jgi:pimeloyl-ACP methyl ester carboxylesterase
MDPYGVVHPEATEATMALEMWERAEIDAANATGSQPVVFVHGLWLLASSWHRWRGHFEERGYATLAPGWPGDPIDVAAARANPEAFQGQKVAMVAEHYAEAIRGLNRRPVIIGHSFGGLLTQKLVGMGLSVAAAPIDPAPHKGVLPLPFSALKGSFPVLRNPLNYRRTVTLTFEQFRYGFANAVDESEARALYDEYHVACPGPPLFQVATANFRPGGETKVDLAQAQRGPVLFISGEADHLVTWSMANAAAKRWQKHSTEVTEITELPNRGHSLILDHGWQEVADTILEFLERHDVKP